MFLLGMKGAAAYICGRKKKLKPDTVIANQSADWCGNPHFLQMEKVMGFFI